MDTLPSCFEEHVGVPHLALFLRLTLLLQEITDHQVWLCPSEDLQLCNSTEQTRCKILQILLRDSFQLYNLPDINGFAHNFLAPY